MSIAYGQQQQAGSQQPNQPAHVPPIPSPNQQHRQLQNRPPNAGPPSQQPPPPTAAHVQKMLDDNCNYIQTIQEFQANGKTNECMQFHQALHRNLVYLAQLAGKFLFCLYICHFIHFQITHIRFVLFRSSTKYCAAFTATTCNAVVDRTAVATDWSPFAE